MKRTHASVAGVTLAGLLTLALAACGSDNTTTSGSGSTSGSSAAASVSSLSGTLNGGGSSAQSKAQQAWVAGFQTTNPKTTVNYSTTDSGSGRKGFLDKSLDFAGSDAALSTDELTSSKTRCTNGGLDLPVYVSPIAVAFNINGVTSLNLSGDVVAKIFAGQITTWNDPAILATNDAAKDKLTGPITTVHRSDDSGTTKNFTDYLNKVAPSVFTKPAGNTWPIQGGQSANGTSGVVQTIQAAQGTIGYADASAVGSLGKVSLGVGSAFVAPTADAAAKTVDASPRDTTRGAGDIVVSIDRKTTAAGAYPAILVSYLVVCSSYDSQATVDLVKGYASYVVSADGQQQAAKAAGSAPISDTLRADVVKAINSITVKS